MKQIKYSYCIDENDEIVFINDLSKETRHKKRLFCLQCGHEMIPNLGSKKVWHFSHKSNCSCDGESYLHKLAKIKIQEKFNVEKNFPITFSRNIPCSEKEKCVFYDEYHCHSIKKIDRDLKTWEGKTLYDICDVEKSYDNFRPDILLTYSKDESRSPIFIEIFKSHESETTKINSNYRIIETTKIQTEEDIDDIIRRGFVEGENCNTYNFNLLKIPQVKLSGIPITRFVLQSNGVAYYKKPFDYEICCDKVYSRICPDSVIELNIGEPRNPFTSCGSLDTIVKGLIYLVLKRGFNIRNCLLCRNYRYNIKYGNNICILYKNLGHSQPHPSQNTAQNCCKYEIENKLINISLEQLEKEVSDVPMSEFLF